MPARLILRAKKLYLHSILPKLAHPGEDLGYDLFAMEECIIYGGLHVKIPTGIAVELPMGWGAIIKDRSSYGLKGIHVHGGVIDPGYRGEIFVDLWNMDAVKLLVVPGDKIGQLIPIKSTNWKVVEVSTLGDSTRGIQGYGSTGR